MTLEQLPPPGLLVSSEQVVAGAVNGITGAVALGSGFTSTRTNTGRYTITFTTAFSDLPIIALTPQSNAGSAPQIGLVLQSTTSITVETISIAGVYTDYSFDFIAYIPSVGKTRVPRDFGIVTALPSGAGTGDLCTFTDSLTAPTYRWRLQYNAASSSSSKWEVIGGSPLFAEVLTQQSYNNASYGDMATVGPSVALPLGGDYMVRVSADFGWAASAQAYMSYAIGVTAAADADRAASATVSSVAMVGYRKRLKTGLAAVTLTSKYKSNGNVTIENRTIEAMPVRVG